MHALTKALFFGGALALLGCKPRVTSAQCDQLLDRYATLVVTAKMPDAGASVVAAEQNRERREAAHDDAFRNCTTEVQPSEFTCAMAATTPEAFEKCLE